MRYQATILTSTLLFALPLGCSGDSKGNDDATATTATTATTDATTGTTGMATSTSGGVGGGSGCDATMDEDGNVLVMASEANNYSFSSTLSFPPINVQPDTELSFDWSAVTLDFLGHPMDASADVDTVNLMLWTLTEAELEQKLNDDDLAQSDLAVIATLYNDTGDTSGTLFNFTSVHGREGPQSSLADRDG